MKTIIHIIGAGRSGSTILDKFLGSHSKSFSLGELGLYETAININMLCSCGEEMNDCTLHGPIINKNKDIAINTLFRLKGDNIFETVSNITKILVSLCFNRNLMSKQTKNILQNNKILISEIDKKVNKKIYIDSTKNVTRAILLSRFYNTNCHNIYLYLVKNPVSNINSRKKNQVKISLKDRVKIEKTNNKQSIKDAIKSWNKQNLITTTMIFLFTARKNRILIKYEDFTLHPEQSFNKLKDKLKINFEHEMLDLNRNEHHIVGGNYSKINASHIKPLKSKNEMLSDYEIKLIKRKTKIMNMLIYKLLGDF